MKSQEVEIFDADSRFTQENLEYPQILMRQVLRISSLGSREMHQGKRIIGIGGGLVEYMPSTSEEYTNSVEVLHNLLYPYFDDEYNSEIKVLKERLSKLISEIKDKESKVHLCSQYNVRSAHIQFTLLNALMARKNLLLEGDKSKVVSK